MTKQKGNRLVIDHLAGRIDRHYANGRVDKGIGSKSSESGALQIRFGGRSMLVHRLIYMDFHGPIAPWMQIDHIHGKEAGNGIGNLRWTDSQGNAQNRRKAHKNSKSGFLGVSWFPQTRKWRATIRVDGKPMSLGLHETPEQAHRAYLEAKRVYHKTCTI